MHNARRVVLHKMVFFGLARVLRLRQLPVSQSRVTTLLPSTLKFRERMAPELLM